MTDDYGTSSPGTGTPANGGWPADDQPTTQLPSVPAPSAEQLSPSAGRTTEVAKDEALGVAGSAKAKSSGLVEEGVDKARSVAGEAGRQARDLMDEARAELTAQASDQQRRVAGGLRTFGQELSSMADGSSEGGLAADVARQVATRTTDLAQWLDERDPGSLLEEVKDFARRRPGAFLAVAAGAGVLAGRLTRGLTDAAAAPAAARPDAETGPRIASHVADTPERVSAWPPTGAYQDGTVGTGWEQGTSGYYAGGDAYTPTAPGYDEPLGTSVGLEPVLDPLSDPLTDPLTDPTREPRNEEGWR